MGIKTEKEIINQEIAKRLMAVKAQTRGINMKNGATFIVKEEGPEGVKKMEKALKELGFPLKFDKVRSMDFYPAGYLPVFFLLTKKLFGWDDQKIRELCGFAVSASLVVRIYMKFFHSVEKMIKKAPEIWREYFTAGELEFLEHNFKEKYSLVEVRNFDLDKSFCVCMEGFLENITKLTINSKEVHCREIACTFDHYSSHKFLIKWQ